MTGAYVSGSNKMMPTKQAAAKMSITQKTHCQLTSTLTYAPGLEGGKSCELLLHSCAKGMRQRDHLARGSSCVRSFHSPTRGAMTGPK